MIVLALEDGEYQRVEYQPGETISGKTFPELKLRVNQVLAAEAEDVI